MADPAGTVSPDSGKLRTKKEFDFAPQVQRCMLFFVYMAMNEWRAAEISLPPVFPRSADYIGRPGGGRCVASNSNQSVEYLLKLKLISLMYQKKYLRPAILLFWNALRMRPKQKVLFINGHLNTGGVERALVDILKHMDNEMYSVDLLLLEGTGDYVRELPSYVRVLFRDLHHTYGSLLPSIRKCFAARDWMCLQLRILFFLRRLIGNEALRPAAFILLGKHHYDCVVGFRPGICSDLAAFPIQADKKITWWHHGAFNVDHKAYADMCSGMDFIVTVSKSCREMLKSEIPKIEGKLVHIPNMLDFQSVSDKATISPYKKGYFHVVSVGRLAQEKHFENVIPTVKSDVVGMY